MAEQVVALEVDGEWRTVTVRSPTSLLRALRDAGRSEVKNGCEEGECGACTVVVDGALACACLLPAAACDGAAVTTARATGDDLVVAFARHGAVQCGFCTPGIAVAAEHLLATADRDGRRLVEADVLEGLAGNLCRCTGYRGIVAAVLEVARARAAGGAG
jgi:aerobic-type carbon monoxide dehydrogenase small subunit (CoxS/CutS family)